MVFAPSRRKRNFIERTAASLAATLDRAGSAGDASQKTGLLQQIDPRVKVFGFLLLIAVAACVRNVSAAAALFVAAIFLASLSRVSFRLLTMRLWPSVLFFAGMVALPAIFLTPGNIVSRVPLLGWPVTEQGLRSAIRLIARTETTATLALLLVATTPWAHVLKALRIFRVPTVVIVILGMAYRYIFLLLRLALDFFEGRRSRLVARLNGRQSRQMAGSASGVLLEKSLLLSNEVFLAMRSRGFRGEVYSLDDFQMALRDWLALAAFLTIAALAIGLGFS